MSRPGPGRTLALAGVFQACRLVQQVARHGEADRPALAASIQSVFALDAPSVEAVYGGTHALDLGLETLGRVLGAGPRSPAGMELARYLIGVLVLERRLARQARVLEALRRDIQALDAPPAGEPPDAACLAALAELYRRHVSPAGPRIMVQGEPAVLAQERHVHAIRALLLAAVRSAVLFRQLGGRRWQLLLQRRHYVEGAARLLGPS